MHSTWFSGTFISLLKFKGALISWDEAILQNSWVIWSPYLYLKFINFKDPNSLSIMRFQCILYDSAVPFSSFWKFIKLKRGDVISWGEPIPHNSWIIWSHLLYFNLRSLKNPNLLPFIRFQYILHDSTVLFWGFWKFMKLKRGDPISWGNQFCITTKLFGPPSCIWILEVWRSQILFDSLDLNAFYMMQ